MPRVPPKLNTPQICPIFFRTGPNSLTKIKENKMSGMGPMIRPGGPWSISSGPDSSRGP